MKLRDFHYDLPEELIAYHPAQKRTASRLLVLNQGVVSHQQFTDVLDYLQPNDMLVVNNTKVIPARLYANKSTGGKVEILIERINADNSADVHAKANKSLKAGDIILLAGQACFAVIGRKNNLFVLKNLSKCSILELLAQYGKVPLPPYIRREATPEDVERYQTVYAKAQGSVAAPTAGLHFDDDMLQKIQDKGVEIAEVTLHVGAGTFAPVRTEDVLQHEMHYEAIDVPADLCEKVRACKAKGGRVFAVGTTSTRSLEAAAQEGELKPFKGETNLYIYPGYQFKVVDCLITNFHLPESTLMLLVSAFAGHQQIMRAYNSAVQEKYRFFSYGDAMLLFRKDHEI